MARYKLTMPRSSLPRDFICKALAASSHARLRGAYNARDNFLKRLTGEQLVIMHQADQGYETQPHRLSPRTITPFGLQAICKASRDT